MQKNKYTKFEIQILICVVTTLITILGLFIYGIMDGVNWNFMIIPFGITLFAGYCYYRFTTETNNDFFCISVLCIPFIILSSLFAVLI